MTKRNDVLPEARMEQQRSTGGTLAGALVAGHLLGGRKESWGFLEKLEKRRRQRKLWPMEKLQCRWGNL